MSKRPRIKKKSKRRNETITFDYVKEHERLLKILRSERATSIMLSSTKGVFFDGNAERLLAADAPDEAVLSGFWNGSSETARQLIETNAKSIGRIQLGSGGVCGTGFLVAKNLVATATHVIRDVTDSNWVLDPNAEIEFACDPNIPATRKTYKIVSFVNSTSSRNTDSLVDYDGFEIGFVRIANCDLPPLVVDKTWIPSNAVDQTGDAAFILGYPTLHKVKGEEKARAMEKFADANNLSRYGTKCICFGFFNGPLKTVRTPSLYATHIASTLPGFSGGPVFDLNTMKVVGVHVSGLFNEHNRFQAFSVLALHGAQFIGDPLAQAVVAETHNLP